MNFDFLVLIKAGLEKRHVWKKNRLYTIEEDEGKELR